MGWPKRKLTARWSKKEGDFIFHHPTQKSDGHYLYDVFCSPRDRFDTFKGRVVIEPAFVDELESRGFDLTTLRFEVSLSQPREEPEPQRPPAPPMASIYPEEAE